MNPVDPAPETAALSRNDYAAIVKLVKPGSKVLDLGCGGGQLLQLLREDKGVLGYGVDLSPDLILDCIGKGLSVFQGNLDEGLRDFEDQSFDYVILNQTLPVVHRPTFVMEEMLRVGRCGIVSFANFAYWRIRLRLLLNGRMPVDEILPNEWYDTPNIHHLTVRDFHVFCRHFGITILDAHYFRRLESGRVHQHMLHPNWFAGFALFVITRNA
jgi:methionine biosynthesis protein MetW